MSTSPFAGRLAALIGRFRRDKKANIAMIFALALVPVVSAIGSAVDYSLASRMRAKLQSAADAASVASISQRSAGFTAASAMSGDGPVPAGVNEANNVFNGNMSAVSGFQNLSLTSTVTKTGIQLASQVQFSADVPVTFMKVLGYTVLTVSGVSRAGASLPPYLDFYLTLDVSSSMGLPSTTAEAVRMQTINPDNWVQYRTGCTLACHFGPQNSACKDPPVVAPAAPNPNPATNANYSQQYNTNNYCMGYVYSRLSQTALANLINQASTVGVPKQVPGLPVAMLPNLNTKLDGSPNSLITGNANSLPYSLTAASSCPTDGTDGCIQLRLDAVGYALTQLFIKANAAEKVANQFRIGLYPFITNIDVNYSPLTASINASPTTPGTINYAAANLASELDTNLDATLGSGGTHIDNALHSLNTSIVTVGDGSTSTNTQPFVFLVTDGAQDPQWKDVPNGSWHGSNHATVLTDPANSYPGICTTMKNRGIIVSVLNIPYQTINPVNTTFAGNEDTYANNNIPNIEPSLQACASPGFYFSAGTPTGINDALKKMFDKALATAHITN